MQVLTAPLPTHAVKSRIKSVQNIKKITSAMKMVAASKMRKAQAAQEQSVGMPTTFLKLFGEHTSAVLLVLVLFCSCALAVTCEQPRYGLHRHVASWARTTRRLRSSGRFHSRRLLPMH